MANEGEKPRAGRGLPPRHMLAFGGLGLTLLGLALLAFDVFTSETRLSGWLALVAGVIALIGAAIWSGMEDAGELEAPPPTPIASAGAGYRDVVHHTPEDRARKQRYAIAAAVGVVLALQAMIPLRYYLGDDEYDERFAWRMFSAVRMTSCAVANCPGRPANVPCAEEVVRGEQRFVPLGSTVHEAWVTTFERNRRASIDNYLRWRCEQPGVESARIESRCELPSGESVPPIEYEIECDSGEITQSGGAP